MTKPYSDTTPMPAASAPPWHTHGLLFENCNCQLVCPGHVHFDQLCTHDRCIGYWAIRFDGGTFGETDLAGVTAVVFYDTPQHMISGEWTQTMVIDDEASSAQRHGVEAILTGGAGGPWAVLARFVARREPTRYLPVLITDGEGGKRVSVEGVLEAEVEPIRGRDRTAPVTFENMFNQIHAPSQVIGRGSTRLRCGSIGVVSDGTHALWSSFSWKGP